MRLGRPLNSARLPSSPPCACAANAGLLLNTKTFAANELLNLTVDRVHAMLLRTTRELQVGLMGGKGAPRSRPGPRRRSALQAESPLPRRRQHGCRRSVGVTKPRRPPMCARNPTRS
jgi:hypothetical protein